MDFTAYDLVNVPVFVLVPDSDGRPVYGFMNAQALARMNTTLSEVVGKPAYEVFSGRAAYAVYRRQLVAWTAAAPVEHEILLPMNEGSMWVRTTLVPCIDSNGHMTHMVGTVVDVTAEQELEHQQALTVAEMREVEDLICLAAHDLRSPIGNLKSLAFLMRKDFVDHGDGKIELIDMIDAIADKSLAVVSDVMARIMARSAPISSCRFDFGDLCDDIVVLLDPLRTHTVCYPRVALEADQTTVQIVLRNLLDNALKFANGPATRVLISVRSVNAQRFFIEMRDSGC
ncbi:MAG: PAS domain-containing protein, partial [Tateyamaria sp.]